MARWTWSLVEQTYDETLAGLIAAGPRPIGIEAGHLTVQRQRWLTAALAAGGWRPDQIVPTMDVIEAGRVVKDEWEIARLREAGRRISAVALGVLADLAPGQREQDVAQAVEAGLRRAGFTRPAFDTIVASGPRAALPHGRASDRTMAAGDLVVLDFGGVYGGYCVDLTRTVVLGTPTAEAARVHGAVAEAQQAAIEALAPGVAVAGRSTRPRAPSWPVMVWPIASCTARGMAWAWKSMKPREWGRHGRRPTRRCPARSSYLTCWRPGWW